MIAIIENRTDLVRNAIAYRKLVNDDLMRLPASLKKVALETISRTQAWIVVRARVESGDEIWLPVPMKWAGGKDMTIAIYDTNRIGGFDLQKIDAQLDRLGITEATSRHPAWDVAKAYADEYGLCLRSNARMWVLKGEDLDWEDREFISTVEAIAAAKKPSAEALAVLADRLVA